MLYLRSLAFNIYFYAVTFTMTVICLPLLALPSRYALAATKLWSIWMIWGMKVLAGTDLEVRGKEYIPTSPAIIASKHQSVWDTFAFFKFVPYPAIVLKYELAFLPLYGWFAKKTGMVFVNRDAQAKALRQMIAVSERRMARNRPVLIFPEGTRAKPGTTSGYKPGVAALYNGLKVPCVPVALNSGLCWPRRTFRRYPGKITIEFLPPIEPGLKKREFLHRLESEIENASARLHQEGLNNLKSKNRNNEPPQEETPISVA